MSANISGKDMRKTILCLRHLADKELFDEGDQASGLSFARLTYRKNPITGWAWGDAMSTKQILASYYLVIKYKDKLVAENVQVPERPPIIFTGYRRPDYYLHSGKDVF